MIMLFSQFFFEHLSAALLFFPLIWLLMRYENGNKLKVGNWWIFLGFLATDFGTALIHFVAIFIIDGNLIAAPGSSYSIFFYLVIPISIAIGVCFLLRKKARNSNLSTNN